MLRIHGTACLLVVSSFVVSDGGSGSSEVIVVRLGGGKCFHRLTCGVAVKLNSFNVIIQREFCV